MTPVDRVLELLVSAGDTRYGGEQVSQLSHALQCATLADGEKAPSHLIAAALLHDIGHLVDGGDYRLALKGIDGQHEYVAANFLDQWFDDSVVAPIGLHVEAKRYLCREDPAYLGSLSPASKRSLAVQGGVFSRAESRAFLAKPGAEDAVRLRRWDDEAKNPNAKTPDHSHFRPYLEAHVRRR